MNHPESAQSARPGYLETFALRREPFAEQIDSRFFYAGTALMQRLDLLTHLTQFGDSIVLVSGPAGSGKTTLLSRFVAQSSNLWRLCLIDAADDFSQFLHRLADALVSDSFTSEQELLTDWANRSESSQLLVILIDNAEKLDATSLDRLCALLNQATADRIRFILFGLPEAQQRLRETFEQKTSGGAIQSLEMPRLNEEETSSYLMYRLAVAGYSGESPFTSTEVRAMCKAADGRPAELNRLANQALLDRQARTRSDRMRPVTGKREVNMLAWGLASAGVLAAAVYLGWQRFYSAPDDKPTADTLDQAAGEIPLALPASRPLPMATQPLPPAKEPTQTGSTSAALSDSTDLKGGESVPPAQTSDSPPPASLALSNPAPKQEERVGVPADPALTAAADAETREKTPPLASPAPISAAEPVRLQKTPATASLPPTSAAETAGTTPRPEKPASPVKKDKAPAAAKKATKDSPLHRESWLLKQSESSFSLQLAGSRNEVLIANFIRRYDLDEHQAAYYRGQHQGAPWYVLMYGVYPSREAALEGRDNLPDQLREAKPWPRSFKSVHASIREAQ